jgi:hypothetical protein
MSEPGKEATKRAFTVEPATYSLKYANAAEAIAGWDNERDFRITTVTDHDYGRYINKQQMTPELLVTIRYNDSENILVVDGLNPPRIDKLDHKAADGYLVTLGAKFWNNDLRVCQVIKVAEHANDYSDTGCVQTWHKTTHGEFDTLNGHMQPYARLARYFEGKDAEKYETGTQYGDIKDGWF